MYFFFLKLVENKCLITSPIEEIIWVKNVRAIVVCGFLMKLLKKKYPENLKKIMGAVWQLPAKQHSQSSPFPLKLGWIGCAI